MAFKGISRVLVGLAVLGVAAPTHAGRDIVRIIDNGASPGPVSPRADTQPPPLKSEPAPRRDPRKGAPNEIAGRFVKLSVRLGALAGDNSRAWLGVNLDNEPLERAFAISVGLMNPSGALVTDTTSGGPAATAGLRAGDIIVALNGSAVGTSDQLRQALARSSPGATASVEAWRFVPDGANLIGTLRQLAEQGNAAIMAMLGDMHANGKGVPRNDNEAVEWYRRAATAGHAVSMVDYARMLGDGRGLAKNEQEALRWYRAAADTGNTYGLWRYALVMLDGKIAPKDTALAAQLLQRAAEAGYGPAMHDFAVMHANAMGMPRNYQLAARWYQKAADLNNAASMVNLGLLYDEGKGVEKDEAMAVNLYRRAVALGHVSGMQNLAVMLDNGRGVARDPEQAAELVLRAVGLGNDFSYRQLLNNHAAYTREFRLAVQRRLQAAGLYSGDIDGEFGQSTQAAITAHHKRRQ